MKYLSSFLMPLGQDRFQYNPVEGSEVPVHLKAVCWNDGANDQLKASIENQQAWKINNITTNKQSAAKSDDEQAEDLGTSFKTNRYDLGTTSHFSDDRRS